MKIVYICSPLRGDVEANIRMANAYCAYAAAEGVVPLAPHAIFTAYLDDSNPKERQQGFKMGIELLSRCDELWVCGSKLTEGMQAEIIMARRLGIPVIKVRSKA